MAGHWMETESGEGIASTDPLNHGTEAGKNTGNEVRKQ